MTARRAAVVACLAAMGAAASACSGGSSSGAQGPTVVNLPTHHPSPVTVQTGSVQNIVISDFTRSQLLVAEAKTHHLPNASFIGMAKANEYFSFDSSAKTFWAAGQIEPVAGSTAAQQAVSGRGSYQVFVQAGKKPWKVYDVGTSGACPLVIPAAVLTAWNWSPGSCRP